MGVTFEQIYKDSNILIGIIRAGAKHKHYGDPYEFSTIVIIKDSVATLKGAVSTTRFNILSVRNKIRLIFKDLGVKKVYWERYRKSVKKLTHKQIVNYSRLKAGAWLGSIEPRPAT